MGVVNELLDGLRDIFAPAAVPAVADDNPNGHGQLVVVRQGFTVQALPGRMKSRRTHTFDDLTSFAAWLNRHVPTIEAQERCEILATDKHVDADLTPADPSSDTVRCLLKEHPLFAAWQGILSKPLQQKQLHAFIRGAVTTFAETEGVNQGDLIASQVRKVQVNGGAELSAELDETGFYRVEIAGARTAIASQIPPSFVVSVPIFAGVKKVGEDAEARYALGILLSMDVAGDAKNGIVFHLSCPELPVVLHQARLDAVAYLRSLLAEGFLVGLGAIGTEDVPALND